jgi:hypothetical protein
MYGIAFGGALTTTSTLVLPDTGGSKALTILSLVFLVIGISLTATAIVKVASARHFNKAK